MKGILRTEYLRRFKLVMKSQLNGKNKIKAANTWAVSLMRYGAGTIKWNNISIGASVKIMISRLQTNGTNTSQRL